MAGTVLFYMALAEATAMPLPGQGLEQLLQPASGLALVLLVVGGLELAPALFIATGLPKCRPDIGRFWARRHTNSPTRSSTG